MSLGVIAFVGGLGFAAAFTRWLDISDKKYWANYFKDKTNE